MNYRLFLVDGDLARDGPALAACCPSFEVSGSDQPFLALEQFRFSEIQPDLLILAARFDLPAAERTDAPSGSDPHTLGLQVLGAFRAMDADVPIIILSDAESMPEAFGAARHQATAFLTTSEVLQGNNLLDVRLRAIVDARHYRYDRAQQQLAEEIAPTYRREETRSAGTLAYWRFEEDKLVETLGLIDKPEVAVLDIGVGDGRNPEALFRAAPERVVVTGVDFSGKMLDQCRKGVLGPRYEAKRLRLERRTAERLELPPASFDLVVAGFGFLSYSETANVLIAIREVARPDAYVLLGSYNLNAFFYDFWQGDIDRALPVSGKIDRDLGILYVGDDRRRNVSVRPKSAQQLTRLVSHHGFTVESLWTFPTLYSTVAMNRTTRLSRDSLDAMIAAAGGAPPRSGGASDADRAPAPPAALSDELYKQDVEYSASLDRAGDHKGYYALVRCRIDAAGPPRRRTLGFASLLDRVEDELERARRFGRPFAILTLDLGAGPPGADALLEEQATEAVSRLLRGTDRMAWSSDSRHIVVLLIETASEDAHRTAHRLLSTLRAFAALARIGIAVYPGDGSDASALLTSASDAARQAAPGGIRFGSEGA